MPSYIKIDKCRICGNSELKSVINLGQMALTGIFPDHKDKNPQSGPLELVRCTSKECGLLQILHSYLPSEMYGDNYGYRSGLNKSMVDHLQQKVKQILDLKILKPGDVIIDIGSNDGTTLKFYPDKQYIRVGIDPSGEKFQNFYEKEDRLIFDFFDPELALKVSDGKKAKVITSFSMFYDLEDPIKFACNIEKVLDAEGIWMLEQSYLPAMLESNSFDTICHEHISYYGLKQIKMICDKADLKIIDISFNKINGGSISLIVAKTNSKYNVNKEKIKEAMENEQKLKLNEPETYENFSSRIKIENEKVLKFLENCKKNKKRVLALGASTKGNVLLQHLKINQELIESIGEINEYKYGKFTPGTNIPILSEKKILESKPDYLLVLPWHFKEYFIKEPRYKGYKLVFPLPYFEIINN